MITKDRTPNTGIDWKYSIAEHTKVIRIKLKRKKKAQL